jgi:hypothetical protein
LMGEKGLLGEDWNQWRTEGMFGGFKPPWNSEVLTKQSRIPSSVENTSVTILVILKFWQSRNGFANWAEPLIRVLPPPIPVLCASGLNWICWTTFPPPPPRKTFPGYATDCNGRHNWRKKIILRIMDSLTRSS